MSDIIETMNILIADADKRDLDELSAAVLAYLSECDNPVPDYSLRRVLRNRLRELVRAPREPVR
jgi:hypothetical protein